MPLPASPLCLLATFALCGAGGETPFALRQELVVPSLRPGDEFGRAVALDGDLAAVSAPERDVPGLPGTNQGAVFVFERNADGSWSLVQEVVPPSAPSLDFGGDVALSGNTLAIGWEGRSAVAVLERGLVTPGEFGFLRTVQFPGGSPPTFGYSVALQGDILAAGGPGLETFYCNAMGSMAVFDRNAGGPEAWGVVLSRFGDWNCDGTGWDVAVDGARVALGEGGDSPFASTCLYACGFYPGAGARITPTSSARFNARSVALQGDVLVLAQRQGALVLQEVGGVWSPAASLANGEPVTHAYAQVALADDLLLMSARSHYAATGTGRVFVHQRDRGGPDRWGRRGRFASPRAAAADRFGAGLAADRGLFLVGAPGDDLVGADAGAAFLFRDGSRSSAVAPIKR